MTGNDLKDYKFKISSSSPDWHIRYNDIVDRYSETLDSNEVSSISGLDQYDCLSLAMNLAKLSPDESITPSWESIESRLSQANVVSIPSPSEVTFRVILPFYHMSYREAEVFLSILPYSWADTEHLSYRLLVVMNSAIKNEMDLNTYEKKARTLFRNRCLKAFHEMRDRYTEEETLPENIKRRIMKCKDCLHRKISNIWI